MGAGFGLSFGLLIVSVLMTLLAAGVAMFVVGRTRKKAGLWIAGIVLGAVGLLGIGAIVMALALSLRR